VAGRGRRRGRRSAKRVTLTRYFLAGVALLLIDATCCCAQDLQATSSEAASSFEELPELTASEILKPELLKGPHHTVRENVPTSSGANQFVIESDFGIFQADGNEMLLQRIKEIYAIAQLKEVSRGEEFKKSLITAAKGPLNSAKNIVKDPAKAISNVPKGVMKFMGRAGQTLKNLGKKDSETDPEGSRMQQMVGYSNAKRKIALSMGIDPYSSNTVLQKELDDIAWASWAGGFAFGAATFPIGGPVGAALTVTNVSSGLDNLLREKTPAELKALNRSALRGMGAREQDADRILSNGAFSPSQATAFVLNLKSLGGVANRGAFVRAAATQASNESDALFCVETAGLLRQIHEQTKPLARIASIGDLPVAIAKDGTVILALQWDYAAWTAGAGAVVDAVQKLASESAEKKPIMVVLSGQVSPLLRQELEKRGITVQDRASPGPLK
jgi:hypothetical protein